MKNYKIETQATGRYEVYYSSDILPQRTRRIGFIIGANKVYLAERGPINLGYFKTKKQAVNAIISEFERKHCEDKPIPLSMI